MDTSVPRPANVTDWFLEAMGAANTRDDHNETRKMGASASGGGAQTPRKDHLGHNPRDSYQSDEPCRTEDLFGSARGSHDVNAGDEESDPHVHVQPDNAGNVSHGSANHSRNVARLNLARNYQHKWCAKTGCKQDCALTHNALLAACRTLDQFQSCSFYHLRILETDEAHSNVHHDLVVRAASVCQPHAHHFEKYLHLFILKSVNHHALPTLLQLGTFHVAATRHLDYKPCSRP
jgi:hypothetical protein